MAATNAVLGATTVLSAQVSPIGSFTDPGYASAGLTEAAARENGEVVAATMRFDSLPRPIIDGRRAEMAEQRLADMLEEHRTRKLSCGP